MPRPLKQRTIETRDPSKTNPTQAVVLSLDEFEVIKRIDYEHLNQELCAKYMNVSRTTVQRIYASARQKLALALIEKRLIDVRGGEVEAIETKPKNHDTLMIAIAIEDNQIALHFGKCSTLMLVDVVKGKLIQSRTLMDETHFKLDRPAFLESLGVNHVLVQQMGKSIYNHYLNHGIQAVQAQSSNIEEALRLFLEDPVSQRDLNPCQIC